MATITASKIRKAIKMIAPNTPPKPPKLYGFDKLLELLNKTTEDK